YVVNVLGCALFTGFRGHDAGDGTQPRRRPNGALRIRPGRGERCWVYYQPGPRTTTNRVRRHRPRPTQCGQADGAGERSTRPMSGWGDPWFKTIEVPRARTPPPHACPPDGRPPGRQRTRRLPVRQLRGPGGRTPEEGQAAIGRFTGSGTGAREA